MRRPFGFDGAAMLHHFAQIRRKLEPDPARPRYFITEARMGYRFTGS